MRTGWVKTTEGGLTIYLFPGVYAAGVPTISGEEKTVSPGDTVEIPVYVTDNPGFSYLKIAFTYNKDVLTLIKIDNGSVSTDAFTKTATSMSWDTGEDTTKNGILCTFTFLVGDGANGDYSIGLRVWGMLIYGL